MRVQFKVSMAGRNVNFGRGEFRDLPEAEAKYYISKGLAIDAPSADEEIAKLKVEIERLKGKKKPEEKRPLKKKVQTRPVDKKE